MIDLSTPKSERVLRPPFYGKIEPVRFLHKLLSSMGDGECASACAQILFPAGFYSVLTPGSVLGFHSCSETSGCNEEIAQAAVKRGFLCGTLDTFTDMFDPGEMRWMTEIPSTPDFQSTRDGALCLFKHNEARVYELIDNEMLH